MGIEVGARGVVESEIVLSLVQPDKGWEVAEKSLPVNSKTAAGKVSQSKDYYRERGKRRGKEKEGLQRTYGDISRFFIRPPSPTPTPAQESIVPSTPPPVSPRLELDSEGAFFIAESFANEVKELELWLKGQKEIWT